MITTVNSLPQNEISPSPIDILENTDYPVDDVSIDAAEKFADDSTVIQTDSAINSDFNGSCKKSTYYILNFLIVRR